MKNNSIDFVVTWVDDSDPVWRKQKEKYDPIKMKDYSDAARYRDWGIFKYWFRSIAKNAPWVNRIYIVTFGHVPSWLNIDNPKIKIVEHGDIIDERYLPLFNSCAIEMNLYKIPGLSENFVYFNDDMFVNKTITADCFFKNQLPKNTYKINSDSSFAKSQASRIRKNCNMLAKKYRKKHYKYLDVRNGLGVVLQNIRMLAMGRSGYMSKHSPAAFLKSAYKELAEKEKDSVRNTMRHRFREDTDISQWLFEYCQLYSGLAIPRNYRVSKYYSISRDLEAIIDDIEHGKHALICLNDTNDNENFIDEKRSLIRAFNSRYPDKSEFEK